MRIAVLADIHGNLAALEAVLNDLEQHQPTQVVVNGDLVNRGPQSREVVERLWELPWAFTYGNHDDLLVRWAKHDLKLREQYQDPLFGPAAFGAAQLSTAHLEWLAKLPFEAHFAHWGVRVTHGSPRHYREGYDERLSERAFTEIRQAFPAQLYIGSHTHRPYQRQQDGVWLYNTGAVGTPFNADPRAQYLLIEGHDTSYRVHFCQVPYNRQQTLEAYHHSGMLDCGLGAEIFYEELRTARSMLIPFWMWAEQQGRPRDRHSWQLFQQAQPERFVEPA